MLQAILGTATRTVTVVDTTAPVINTASIVGNVYEGETALGSVSANESVTWSVSGSGVSISSSGVITLDNPADYGVCNITFIYCNCYRYL